MSKTNRLVNRYGRKILESENMQIERTFFQHGCFTTYDHSVHVAIMSVKIARFFPMKFSYKSLVKGALLHDYFLYDWHNIGDTPKGHAYIHPIIAASNAKRDFDINAKEENIIESHMFPLGKVLPKSREAWVVTVADKICAVTEFFSLRLSKRYRRINKMADHETAKSYRHTA